MDFAELLSGIIAVVSGAVTSVVMGALQKASTAVAGLPDRLKQAIVLVIAFAVTQLNGWLGLALPVDALTWSADAVNTLVTALLAFGAYNLFGGKKDDPTAVR